MANQDLKRFIKSFSIILIGIYCADFAIGQWMAYLYRKQISGVLYRSTYSLDSTRADILVLGSSRANHHYDPAVFEEKMNRSFYNCGRDAQGIIYSCAFASGILNRYHPQGIIIDMRPDEFTLNDEGNLTALLPYKDNPFVRPFIKYNSSTEEFKLISHIYPYNSLLSTLLVGISSFNEKRSQDYKGYLPLKGSSASPAPPDLHESGNKVNSNQVNCFKDLLTLLNNARIPTLIVISPLHGVYQDGLTVQTATGLCGNYPYIRFLNYLHDPLCTQGQYFADDFHLNDEGAKLFSLELAGQLKSIMISAGSPQGSGPAL